MLVKILVIKSTHMHLRLIHASVCTNLHQNFWRSLFNHASLSLYKPYNTKINKLSFFVTMHLDSGQKLYSPLLKNIFNQKGEKIALVCSHREQNAATFCKKPHSSGQKPKLGKVTFLNISKTGAFSNSLCKIQK